MLFEWWDKYYLHVAVVAFFLLINAAVVCYFGILFQQALQDGRINGNAAENVNNKAKQDAFRTWMILFAISAFADGLFILFNTK